MKNMHLSCIALLVLSVVALHCSGQETKLSDAERLPNIDKLYASLDDPAADMNPVDLRNELNEVVQEEPSVGEQLIPSAVQTRSSKDDSINTNSASARFPLDCADVMRSGETTSGVYTVYVGRLKRPVSVYCDMTSGEGGWTVFQRRKDGSVRFERKWGEYAAGFGNIAGEFWLGNDVLHVLTKTRKYQLRIDLHDCNNTSVYALYSDFKMAAECDNYKLISVGAYCGNAGDSLSPHVGQKFSTLDQDNDIWEKSCSVVFKGAWWYSNCHSSNLNGVYYRGAHTSYADGVNWATWTGYHYSLKFVEMKIRPIEF